MSSTPITIASSVDAAFLPSVGPLAVSIGRFAAQGRPIDYRVFYAGAESAETRALDGLRVGPLSVRIIPAPANFEKYRGRSRMGVATLLRLYAGEVMPDLDRVLFIDTDLMFRDDIGKLFDAEIWPNPLGAVVDYSVYLRMDKERRQPPGDPISTISTLLRKEIGLTETNWHTYVNTGVVVMDLVALRQEHFGDRAVALLDEKAERLPWPDQDVLNILLRDRITLLDPRWNVLAQTLRRQDLSRLDPDLVAGIRRQRADHAVVHYAGHWKPWLRTSLVPYAGDWWYFAKRSPVYSDLKSQNAAVYRQRHLPPNPLVAIQRMAAERRLRLAEPQT